MPYAGRFAIFKTICVWFGQELAEFYPGNDTQTKGQTKGQTETQTDAAEFFTRSWLEASPCGSQ